MPYYVCSVAIFFSKRVLTEKVSKISKLMEDTPFYKYAISVTNEHLVLLYDEYETKCIVVWTIIPTYFFDKNEEINKMNEFYSNARISAIDFDGIALTNGSNFITSGFIEILTGDINDDRVWLVSENLCKIGSLIRGYVMQYIKGDMNMVELIESIKENHTYKLLSGEIHDNSVKLTNSIFWKKYGNVRIIND